MLGKEIALWRTRRAQELRMEHADRLRLRREAAASLAEFYLAAQKCVEAHEAASMEMPPILRALLVAVESPDAKEPR